MKKAVLVFILAVSLILTCTSSFAQSATPDKFTDISDHWAKDAINKVADENIFAGEKFQPNKHITRSEFALMLHKALGIQIEYFKAIDINEFFDDVKNEDPVASALYDLVTANIIDFKGSFKPDGTLQRDDMVHYIINALNYMTDGDYPMIMIYPQPFKDDSDINPAYKDDFVKAQVLKLVNGAGNRMYLPKNSATRAEAAAIVFRLQSILESYKAAQEVQVIPSAEEVNDGINMKLILANNTKNPVTINHTSGQKYDFELLDKDRNTLYRWSADKMFAMLVGSTVLQPGESIEFGDTVKPDNMDKAVYMKAFIVGDSKDFTIKPEGYEVRVTKNTLK